MALTSVSGLGVSGLASGLDTAGIISKLMAIEAQPQAQLKTQLSSAATFRTALQSLNASVAAIATAAKAASTAGSLTAFTATSDNDGVTAKASSTATAGSLSFTVDRMSAAQVSVTDAMPTWPDASSATPSITVRTGSGTTAKTTTVTARSTSLDDVVAAINAGGAGVSATKVAAGTDSSGAPQYRIQLKSTTPGAAGAFAVFEGADTTGAQLPATTVAAGQDASLTLWPGTAVAQTVTSPTNTFSDLLTGVDVSVSATTTTAATLTVAADPGTATSSAASLTSGLTALFSNLAAQTAVTSTGSNGTTTGTRGGVFTGDLSVRQLKDALLSAATGAVDGRSPSSIGITLTKDGTITFDRAAFGGAMAKDPAGTTAMYQTIASRVASAASAASDPYGGTLTSRIGSQQSQESRLTIQISGWDSRLATIKAHYQTQYNALETALSGLSSQASYLSSQLAGLTTNYASRN